jgi:hypothetical protein
MRRIDAVRAQHIGHVVPVVASRLHTDLILIQDLDCV